MEGTVTTEMIEFDSPAVGGGTVRQSGRFLEKLPNGMVKVEILVGGDPTYKIVTPAGEDTAPAPRKEPRKRKAKVEPKVPEIQLDLFGSVVQGLKEELEKLKAQVNPPAAENSGLDGLEINDESILRPEYIHPDVEGILGGKLPDHRVFARPHIRGDRHYMYGRPNPDMKSARQWLIFPPLPGVTSIIKATCPTPPSLTKWMASFPGGYEAAKEHTNLMAAKGTIMHGVLADVVNGLVPAMGTSGWHRYIGNKMRRQKVDVEKHHAEWEWFMRKAILSFLQWIEDYEVTIVLMEIALVSEELGYAGQIDLFCEMNDRIYTKPTLEVFPVKKAKAAKPTRITKAMQQELKWRRDVEPCVKKGKWHDGLQEMWDGGAISLNPREPEMDNILEKRVPNPRKRIKAIVDFKSGENSYETHAHQLGFYVPLFREAFPNCDLAGARVFNWHPKDWNEGKEKFTYSLIDQSLKLSQERTNCLLALYNLDAREDIPAVMQIEGIPAVGVKPETLVSSKPFTEHWEETFHLAMDLGLSL